jgi:hypothetical protein
VVVDGVPAAVAVSTRAAGRARRWSPRLPVAGVLDAAFGHGRITCSGRG